jgi:hypothetical protein
MNLIDRRDARGGERQQPFDIQLHTYFLERFANGSGFRGLERLDESSGWRPFPLVGGKAPSHQQDMLLGKNKSLHEYGRTCLIPPVGAWEAVSAHGR